MKKQQRGGTIVGFIIGLVVGLGVALVMLTTGGVQTPGAVDTAVETGLDTELSLSQPSLHLALMYFHKC